MSPKLSPYAVHRIIYFLKNDDRRCRAVKKTSAAPTMQYVRKVDMSWKCIYTHYFLQNPPPPMDYLRSLELMLIVKKDLDSEDMQAVFRHGKPMVFDADIPRLLVPKTVEAFQQLKEEPPFLDVTLCSSAGTWTSDLDILAVWPQAYIDYVPSAAWTTAEERGRANQGKPQNVKRSRDDSGTHVASSLVDAQAARFVVEEFHIPSKHFGKELTVELHFTLDNRPRYAARIRPSTASNLVKNELRNVTLRLCDLPCSGSRSETVRRSKTPLLLADFAFEVYGFLDRAHVGTSLLANSALNELIFKLRNRLPVHHLTCEFEPRIVMSSGRRMKFSGAYWMVLRHFPSDLPYSDVRRLGLPSEAGSAADCALILHYLSNIHLLRFERPYYDSGSRFTVKMLAALAGRNFSIDTLEMWGRYGGLSDYRSMRAAFNGGMRLASLELDLPEHKFADLVKTADFFRTSTVRRLKSLKLRLGYPLFNSEKPRRWSIVPHSLWISGILLLRSSELFEVAYESHRPLRPVARKLVQLCEKFERGEITGLVRHFKFSTSRHMTLPFKEDNKTASEVRVADYEWDVYRFRNAATGDWLTACVGQQRSANSRRLMLHIVKGEVDPDASFDA